MPPIPRSSQLHRPGSSPQGGNRCGRSEGSVPGRKKSMNPAYRPMLATLVDEPFDDKKWIFETKWDGFRLITEKRGHAVRLWSRNGIDVTTRYAVLLGCPAICGRSGHKSEEVMVEEQSFVSGLYVYLSGLHADRIERSAKGEDCEIKLVFRP